MAAAAGIIEKPDVKVKQEDPVKNVGMKMPSGMPVNSKMQMGMPMNITPQQYDFMRGQPSKSWAIVSFFGVICCINLKRWVKWMLW